MTLSRFRKIWAYSLPHLLISPLSLALFLALSMVLSLSALLLLPDTARAEVWPQPSGAAYAVLEAGSGQVLYEQNGDLPLPPASTCKIATALLTLRLCPDLERQVTVSPAAAAVGESSIYLRAGETLTIADLLRGALVHSGNDACFALAEAVAGSEPLFVHWLNMQALLLGAYSACFKNTNGLPAEGHQISAVDLGLITIAGMEQPFFAETVASKYTELGDESNYRYYRNTNRLLWQEDRVVGVKTGTTDAAGPCLVAAWREGTALFVSVAFNSSDRYGASLSLLRFAAGNYTLLCPVSRGQAVAVYEGELLYALSDVSILRPRQEAGQVTVRWELPHRLLFLDEQGRTLAATELTTAAELAAGRQP